MLLPTAGPTRGGAGDVGCDAGDDAGREKTLDWMTATGRG
jgi:hypothetical protein